MNNIQAVLLLFMLAKIEEVEGFQPEPFRALVIVDKNVKRTEFVNSVVQNFPDGSSFDRQISFGGAVSSAFLDNTIFDEFNANKFNKEAEIVLVFVNTSTKLDVEPEFSWKKKTLVVLFGSSVPETWKNVATDDIHLFLVTRDINSSRIIERLIKQIESVVWSKSKEENLARSSSSTPIPVTIYAEKVHKNTVVNITGVIIAVIIGVIVISVIIYCIKKRKLLTPSNSDRDVRSVPLSTAHQETGGQGNDGSPLINSGQEVDSNMPDEGECRVNLNEAGLSSDGDDDAGPCMTNPENMPVSISLKNKQEADLSN